MSVCGECRKFATALEAVKRQARELYGRDNPRFFREFLPRAIETLEKIKRHCRDCTNTFDEGIKHTLEGTLDIQRPQRIIQSFHDLRWQEEKEQERHRQMKRRAEEVIAKLRACQSQQDYQHCYTYLVNA